MYLFLVFIGLRHHRLDQFWRDDYEGVWFQSRRQDLEEGADNDSSGLVPTMWRWLIQMKLPKKFTFSFGDQWSLWKTFDHA